MASYHLSVQVLGRSDGRSAVAAAAYRAGSLLTCQETGAVHDYRRRGGVLDTFVLAPPEAPAWASDRAELWNRVHAKETRSNSQLARELRVALPHELDQAEASELLRSWVQAELVAEGMAADVAIHAPSATGDERNVHAHVLVTMRPFDATRPDGWSKNKARDWNSTATLERWRISWAAAQNRALARAGVEERVEHRSLESQRLVAHVAGDELLAEVLDRPPEPRLGLAAGAVERRAHDLDPEAPPVTERGANLAEARRLRGILLRAYESAQRAARAVSEALRAAPTEPPAPGPATGPERIPDEDDMTPDDRTRTALTRQLRGLGLDELELTVKGRTTEVRTVTPAQILAEIPELKRMNSQGANLWIRPPRDQDHDLVLVDLDDRGRGVLDQMKAQGHAPAVAVETSPGSFQAWVRLGRAVPALVRHGISRRLKELYGGDPGAVDPHQSGRLAGFTNRKPEHEGAGGQGRYPFAMLLNAPGKPAARAAELIDVGEAYAATIEAAARIRIEAAATAPAALVEVWRAEYPIQAAQGRTDLSAVDWSLTHQALAAGMDPADVAAALTDVADRKGNAAQAYAQRTVEAVIRDRAAHAPTEPDLPSPT